MRGSLEVGERFYIHCEFDVPTESSLVGKTVSQPRDVYEVHALMYQINRQPTLDSRLSPVAERRVHDHHACDGEASVYN